MKNKKLLYILLAVVLVAAFVFIRNSSESGKELTDGILENVLGVSAETSPSSAPAASVPQGQTQVPTVEIISEQEPAEEGPEAAVPEEVPAADASLLDEDGVYDSKDDVALYLHLYHHLPSNYLTKNEAKARGWSGNGGDKLDKYCPGMCIGGDYFGNNEGLLPKGKYHECDIDTLGAKNRGVKRIVFSDDGYVYYTEDHYESFELLYEP